MEAGYYYNEAEEPPMKGGKIKRECNDFFFTLLFLGSLIVAIVFAAMYGSDVIDATKSVETEGSSGMSLLMANFAYLALIAIGISLAWLVVMILTGELLIWLSIFMVLAVTAASGVLITLHLKDQPGWSTTYFWPGVAFGILFLLELLFLCCNWRRIRFAAKNLKVACKAIMSHPLVIGLALLTSFIQMAWYLTWVLSLYGIVAHTNPDWSTFVDCDPVDGSCRLGKDAGTTAGIFVAMLLLFCFVQATIAGTVIVTVAGVVGNWWVKGQHGFVTIGAWLRAWTLSLGSVAFGALLVAILETIRSIFESASRASQNSGNCVAACVLCCAACIIRCIEEAVKYINKYAYVYVGVYGYSFLTAGSHVFELFANRGWSAIVNDTLIDNVFWLACLSTGALNGYLGVVLAGDTEANSEKWNGIANPQAVLCIGGILIGYSIARVSMNAIQAAVASVFVLWAEDPAALNLTHPNSYEELGAAWRKHYPEEYESGLQKSGSTYDYRSR